MQPNEVRDPQVAANRAPAEDGQARATIGKSNSVRHVADHQDANEHADQAQRQAEAQRPRPGGIEPALEQQQHGHERTQCPDEADERAHDREERTIQRRADVEVARSAAHDLSRDNRHLDQQRHCRPPGRHTH
jgi:hypothetical protein